VLGEENAIPGSRGDPVDAFVDALVQVAEADELFAVGGLAVTGVRFFSFYT
jgi:hypothetical protein